MAGNIAGKAADAIQDAYWRYGAQGHMAEPIKELRDAGTSLDADFRADLANALVALERNPDQESFDLPETTRTLAKIDRLAHRLAGYSPQPDMRRHTEMVRSAVAAARRELRIE